MARTVNLAILVVCGGGAEVTREAVEAHRGRAGGEREGACVHGFASPTDAVLAGLALTLRQPGATAGVCLGEVTDEDGALSGHAVEVAVELAAMARRGEVLLVEAVYLAMNRVETSASPTNREPGEVVAQRIYRAEPGGGAGGRPRPASGGGPPPPAPAPMGTLPSISLWTPLFLLVAFLLGTYLAGGEGLASGAGDAAGRAEALSRKGQHREAAHAFLRAYQQEPGRPLYEARFRESILLAVDEAARGGRPDAGFHLLLDALAEDPFRRDLEDRLAEVGLEYLGALLAAGSHDAYPRERARLLEALPLREQELRDELVGGQAQELMKGWRDLEYHRPRGEYYTEHLQPLWKESPENPALYLMDAEVLLEDGRLDRFVSNMETVLDRAPEWKQERRQQLVDLALRSMAYQERASTRARYMDQVVDFCVQRLGDVLEEKMQARLEAEALGARVGAFRFLERRGELAPEQVGRFHRQNLQGVHAVGEAEGPLKDTPLVREALAFVRSVRGEVQQELVNLLEEASRSEDLAREKQLVEEIRSEVARMRLGGGG